MKKIKIILACLLTCSLTGCKKQVASMEADPTPSASTEPVIESVAEEPAAFHTTEIYFHFKTDENGEQVEDGWFYRALLLRGTIHEGQTIQSSYGMTFPGFAGGQFYDYTLDEIRVDYDSEMFKAEDLFAKDLGTKVEEVSCDGEPKEFWFFTRSEGAVCMLNHIYYLAVAEDSMPYIDEFEATVYNPNPMSPFYFDQGKMEASFTNYHTDDIACTDMSCTATLARRMYKTYPVESVEVIDQEENIIEPNGTVKIRVKMKYPLFLEDGWDSVQKCLLSYQGQDENRDYLLQLSDIKVMEDVRTRDVQNVEEES